MPSVCQRAVDPILNCWFYESRLTAQNPCVLTRRFCWRLLTGDPGIHNCFGVTWGHRCLVGVHTQTAHAQKEYPVAVSCNYRFISASNDQNCISLQCFQDWASGFMIMRIIGLFRFVMVTSLRRPHLPAASDQSQRQRSVEN